MDLIYTDKNGIDKNIMPTYELDAAFGRDENDFECTIAIEDHCCAPQDRIYMKDSVGGKNKWTDIGGIIDQIKLNTESGDVMYSGRTWHGILEGKVLCPDAGQATIQFPDSEDEPFAPPQDGAEGLLLSLLYGWADETATLQESELYNDAREYHEAVFARLEQLSVQGRHGLRAAGVVELEQKTRKFGFADAHRTLYTPRGVRTAAQMKGYRMWMDKQSSLPPEKWRDAALLGAFEQIDNVQFELAESIADALINGAMAGENAEKR